MVQHEINENGTAIDVPVDDGHVRWMLGRLRGHADAMTLYERKRSESECARDDGIIEAIREGFAERDVARFAKVRVGYVRELVQREQQVRLGWAS